MKQDTIISNLKMVCAILICVIATIVVMQTRWGNEIEPSPKVEQPITTTVYDTSWLDEMQQYFDNQTIRMVYGYGYEDENSILDEAGKIWYSNISIPYGEKVLLWIADPDTPENYTDDIIIKVWREGKG